MKRIALLTVLLLSACKSSTDVIDSRSFSCGPGQDLEIRAGLEDPRIAGESLGQFTFLVEVANNSSSEVTVQSVGITPRTTGDKSIQSAYRDFDQVIAEAEDHVFRLPVTELPALPTEDVRQLAGRPFEFVVTVRLTNGDVYRCPFATERPR